MEVGKLKPKMEEGKLKPNMGVGKLKPKLKAIRVSPLVFNLCSGHVPAAMFLNLEASCFRKCTFCATNF